VTVVTPAVSYFVAQPFAPLPPAFLNAHVVIENTKTRGLGMAGVVCERPETVVRRTLEMAVT